MKNAPTNQSIKDYKDPNLGLIHNTNEPLSDKNILALDRQINCQLKNNNNSIGDESMFGNLSI